MAFCPKCGASIEDNTSFCPTCGYNLNEQATVAQPVVIEDEKDANDNKIMGVLAYFGILCLVPMFAAKNSAFAQYHARNGFKLFVISLAFSVASWILGIIPVIRDIFPYISGIVNIIIFILAIIGIINAAKGEKKELPILPKLPLMDKIDELYNKIVK